MIHYIVMAVVVAVESPASLPVCESCEVRSDVYDESDTGNRVVTQAAVGLVAPVLSMSVALGLHGLSNAGLNLLSALGPIFTLGRAGGGAPYREFFDGYDPNLYIALHVMGSVAVGPLVYSLGDMMGHTGEPIPTVLGALAGSALTVAPFVWAVTTNDVATTVAMSVASQAVAILGAMIAYELSAPNKARVAEEGVSVTAVVVPTPGKGFALNVGGTF